MLACLICFIANQFSNPATSTSSPKLKVQVLLGFILSSSLCLQARYLFWTSHQGRSYMHHNGCICTPLLKKIKRQLLWNHYKIPQFPMCY